MDMNRRKLVTGMAAGATLLAAGAKAETVSESTNTVARSAPPVLKDIRFHHGGITVRNLNDAITWYGRVLGFKVAKTFVIPLGNNSKIQVAMLRRDGMQIELFQPETPQAQAKERSYPDKDIETIGNKHIAFAILNVDETLKDLKEADVDIAASGHYPWGANIFIRDPFGTLVELVDVSAGEL